MILPLFRPIQKGCIEGKLEGVPELSGDFAKHKICSFFRLFQGVVPVLIGLKIVDVYTLPGGYGDAAVQQLARYCDGDAAEAADEVVPESEGSILIQLQRRTLPMHYLGVIFSERLLFQYNQWESHGLSPIFIMRLLEEDPEIIVCVMVKWLNDYHLHIAKDGAFDVHEILLTNLRYDFPVNLKIYLQRLDHSFALKVLGLFEQFKSETLTQKPWSEHVDRVMINFICGAHLRDSVKYSIVKVTDLYFNGDLPIEFSEDERRLMLLQGLQNRKVDEIGRIMNMSEEEIYESWRRIIERAFDYVNGLFPEVLD